MKKWNNHNILEHKQHMYVLNRIIYLYLGVDC